MMVETTALEGVVILTPRRFADDRGWFSETWNAAQLAGQGLPAVFVQDNHSHSARKGTLRGLHYQAPPRAQDKLVRCTQGAILDVAVDFRQGSPGFGRWVAVRLGAGDGRQLFVPRGFLHGFVTLTDACEVQYKCTDTYAPDCEGSVRWDDPDLGIDWGLEALGVQAPLLSPKDAAAPLLRDVTSPFTRDAQP
ncbi:MAG: dTDP-4-dehydrorhamnose 3,5-epimerase [Pseudorhodobacter sp.]